MTTSATRKPLARSLGVRARYSVAARLARGMRERRSNARSSQRHALRLATAERAGLGLGPEHALGASEGRRRETPGSSEVARCFLRCNLSAQEIHSERPRPRRHFHRTRLRGSLTEWVRSRLCSHRMTSRRRERGGGVAKYPK